MAKAKVVYSQDAVTVLFKGDPHSPEPATGIIKFPGGHVEVSRCINGEYWAHIAVVDPSNVVDGRIDRNNRIQAVSDLPEAHAINHIAIRVANVIPHDDW